ncbi:hypothetical protein [Proteocatella sphenisci]|uniref:hypothetical protein n=1 Tax=Proteocatella sphenisci TaxID=181070 RepID=UPI00048FFB0C|nr:hypothetical protein [Proteocatella sphenisci]
MQSTIESLFPTTIRLNRKKNNFDKFIIPLCILLALTSFIYSYFIIDTGMFLSVIDAFRKTILCYVTYLIMVELSPDSVNIYLPSFILTSLFIIGIREVHLMTTFFFLFTIRLLIKSSGYRSSLAELSAMTIFTIVQYFISPFIYPLFFGTALFVDYKLKPDNKQNLPFIVISFMMSLLWFFRGFGVMTVSLDAFSSMMVLIIGIAYILRLSLLKAILSMNDLETNLISPRRVKASALLLLISLIILAVGHGMVTEFLNLWIMAACISFPFLKDLKHVISG